MTSSLNSSEGKIKMEETVKKKKLRPVFGDLLQVRISEGMKRELERHSYKKGMTTGQFVRFIIARELDFEEMLPVNNTLTAGSSFKDDGTDWFASDSSKDKNKKDKK